MGDGLKTPYVDPVQIGGKWFEKSDLQVVVEETLKVLKRGFNKPGNTKTRHAKFVCACVDAGCVTISASDRRLVRGLANNN